MTNLSLATDIAGRRVPGLGGFNLTVLKLEVRRLTRNRRTVIISIVLPILFFLLFGLNQGYDKLRAGHGNVSAFVMISLALTVLCSRPRSAAPWSPSNGRRAGAGSCG
jgi:ABC-2 type transport system permease protein